MDSSTSQTVAPNSLVHKPVPFAAAAIRLADLCTRVDEGEDITPQLREVFAAERMALVAGVDEAKHLKTMLEGLVESSKRARDYWGGRARELTMMLDTLKSTASAVMQEHPDLPYTDSFGTSLRLQRNSAPAMKLTFEFRESATVTNIVDAETVSFFNIPAEYIEEVSFLRLDTKKLKDDLAAGKLCDWASLARGFHVRNW